LQLKQVKTDAAPRKSPLTIPGYLTITMPVMEDKMRTPVGFTLQQTAWAEGTLIKWASAIEDVRNDLTKLWATTRLQRPFGKNHFCRSETDCGDVLNVTLIDLLQ
jgi:hypothetical protein